MEVSSTKSSYKACHSHKNVKKGGHVKLLGLQILGTPDLFGRTFSVVYRHRLEQPSVILIRIFLITGSHQDSPERLLPPDFLKNVIHIITCVFLTNEITKGVEHIDLYCRLFNVTTYKNIASVRFGHILYCTD